MATVISQTVIERMRAAKERVQSETKGGGGPAFPRWDLTGKKPIAQPGTSVIVRMMPRWDIADKFVVVAGKRQVNPEYVEDMIYFEAYEHWFNRHRDNQRLKIFCPRTWERDAPCPMCEESRKLKQSADEEDVKYGRDIEARGSFLFNAVVGRTGDRRKGEDGLVDIRVLPVSGTIFCQIIDLMTGGDEEGFSCGDVSDLTEGYDLKLDRPPANTNERWKVTPARQASPLITAADQAAFKGWFTRLHDIPTLLEGERFSYDDLYMDLHGKRPTPGAAGDAEEDNLPDWDAEEGGDDLAAEIIEDADGGGDAGGGGDDGFGGGSSSPDVADPFGGFGFEETSAPASPPPSARSVPATRPVAGRGGAPVTARPPTGRAGAGARSKGPGAGARRR